MNRNLTTCPIISLISVSKFEFLKKNSNFFIGLIPIKLYYILLGLISISWYRLLCVLFPVISAILTQWLKRRDYSFILSYWLKWCFLLKRETQQKWDCSSFFGAGSYCSQSQWQEKTRSELLWKSPPSRPAAESQPACRPAEQQP